MNTFRFRLTTVQRVRENQRSLIQQDLAAAQRKEDELLASLTRLNCELSTLRQQQSEAIAPGQLNIDQLVQLQKYESLLIQQKQKLETDLSLAQAASLCCREKLIEADQSVRVLEKLQASQREKHLKLVQLAEAKTMDEVALRCEMPDSFDEAQ